MLDRVRDRNIRLIYLTILLVGIAYGISIAVIAHALDERGFAKGEIGQLAAIFASGIVVMSLPASGKLPVAGDQVTNIVPSDLATPAPTFTANTTAGSYLVVLLVVRRTERSYTNYKNFNAA